MFKKESSRYTNQDFVITKRYEDGSIKIYLDFLTGPNEDVIENYFNSFMTLEFENMKELEYTIENFYLASNLKYDPFKHFRTDWKDGVFNYFKRNNSHTIKDKKWWCYISPIVLGSIFSETIERENYTIAISSLTDGQQVGNIFFRDGFQDMNLYKTDLLGEGKTRKESKKDLYKKIDLFEEDDKELLIINLENYEHPDKVNS